MTLHARSSCILLLAVVLVASAWAKGATVRIVISGPGMPEPLSIADPEVVREFSIWSGPNSRWRVKDGPWQTDYSRIFIDFPGGQVDAPTVDLLVFDVEFLIADTPGGTPWDETYRVRYAIDPGEPGGFMFLPVGNPFIHHGVEGSWLRSTGSWEALVRPILQQQLARGHSSTVD